VYLYKSVSNFAVIIGEYSCVCYYAYRKKKAVENGYLLDFWGDDKFGGQLPCPLGHHDTCMLKVIRQDSDYQETIAC